VFEVVLPKELALAATLAARIRIGIASSVLRATDTGCFDKEVYMVLGDLFRDF